jgi:hypothetical protein
MDEQDVQDKTLSELHPVHPEHPCSNSWHFSLGLLVVFADWANLPCGAAAPFQLSSSGERPQWYGIGG